MYSPQKEMLPEWFAIQHRGSNNNYCSMSACANVTRGPKRRLASIDGPCFARAKMEMNPT